jgi:uncharacterized membrane protein (DUF2068 family)
VPLTKGWQARQLKADMQEILSNSNSASAGGRQDTGQALHPHGKRERGLLLVGLFKLSKAIFFTALGAGALHLVHRNIGDLVMRIVDALPVDPEGRLVSLLMDKADLIDTRHLRQAGVLSCLYAVVCVVEGTGLMLEKTWAEYFTTFLTAAALPWEIYELFAHFSGFRVGLLLVNLGVLGYLLWFLKRKRLEEEEAAGRDQVPSHP